MKLFINGKEFGFDQELTLLELMGKIKQPLEGVALAVNNQVVPAGSWDKYKLGESDNLTIIKAVQGG